MSPLIALRRLLMALLRFPVALWLLFEEWGWEPLQAALAWVGRLPGLRWVEGLVRRLPPYPALAVLALPALGLIPVKLLAVALLTQGHAIAGVALLLGAKLLGTAVVARLFTLTKPALMRLPWFVKAYRRYEAWKNQLLDWVRAGPVWRMARKLKTQMKRWWKRGR